LYGRTFALVTHRHNWGEARVYYHDDEGRVCGVPVQWTNLAPADPFVVMAAGRSAFRLADLVELSRLLEHLTLVRTGPGGVK
jgi:hypothetical protein